MKFLTKAEEFECVQNKNYIKLLNSIEPYIKYMVGRRFKGIEYKDAYQASWLRLLKSVHNFDPNKGKLTTWVTYNLRDCFSRFKNRQSLVKIPYVKRGFPQRDALTFFNTNLRLIKDRESKSPVDRDLMNAK